MKKAKNGTRFSNLLLDSFILSLLIFGVSFVLDHTEILFFMTARNWSTEIFFTLHFSYYYFFESTLGRTPAKFITTTRTVDFAAGKPTKKQIALRTLGRYIPFDAISFLLGGIGWHDKFSRTTVIDI